MHIQSFLLFESVILQRKEQLGHDLIAQMLNELLFGLFLKQALDRIHNSIMYMLLLLRREYLPILRISFHLLLFGQ